MTDISIIGAGRLGTSLGFALSKKGYRIKALSCKTLASARQSGKIIGEGKSSTDNIQAAKAGKIIFLSVPDEEIQKIAREIVNSDIDWAKKYVFHCSGLLSSEILKPLSTKGAMTASFHPVQSFSQKNADPCLFEGIYFGLEGDSAALALSRKIISQLGGKSIILQAKNKAIYHAACSIASNFLVVILDMASALLKEIGFKEEETLEILFPLVQGTLHNVKNFNTTDSLTGPAIRGDFHSIRKHLEALKSFPSYYETYKKVIGQALEIAKKGKRLTPQRIKNLETLLGGK